VRSTMLMLSERWLTTQTSVLVRAATATGSKPTGTEPVCVRPPASTAKISRRFAGGLTANHRVPSGVNANGRHLLLLKQTNPAYAGAARRNVHTIPVSDSSATHAYASLPHERSIKVSPSLSLSRIRYCLPSVLGRPVAPSRKPLSAALYDKAKRCQSSGQT